MRQKIILLTVKAVFAIVIAFFLTMVMFNKAPDKNKVFVASASMIFLFVAGYITDKEDK
jgi:hypothetical protein